MVRGTSPGTSTRSSGSSRLRRGRAPPGSSDGRRRHGRPRDPRPSPPGARCTAPPSYPARARPPHRCDGCPRRARRRVGSAMPSASSAGRNASAAGLNHPVSSLNDHPSNHRSSPNPVRRSRNVGEGVSPTSHTMASLTPGSLQGGQALLDAGRRLQVGPLPHDPERVDQVGPHRRGDRHTEPLHDEVGGVGGRVLAGVGLPLRLEPGPVLGEHLHELVTLPRCDRAGAAPRRTRRSGGRASSRTSRPSPPACPRSRT